MKKIVCISFLFYFILFACEKKQENTQQLNENRLKTSINNYVNQCWNNKDLELFEKLSTEKFIRNINGIKVANNQNEMQAAMNVFFKGFPDLKVDIKNITVKDSMAFVKWTFNGTNTGVFGEIAATGKKVKITGFTRATYSKEGKIKQEDVYYNELALLQQLGYKLIPPVVK